MGGALTIRSVANVKELDGGNLTYIHFYFAIYYNSHYISNNFHSVVLLWLPRLVDAFLCRRQVPRAAPLWAECETTHLIE